MTTNSCISDDEYRLLRQNLFERFGSGAVVPGEPPVVPIGGQTKHIKGGESMIKTPPVAYVAEAGDSRSGSHMALQASAGIVLTVLLQRRSRRPQRNRRRNPGHSPSTSNPLISPSRRKGRRGSLILSVLRRGKQTQYPIKPLPMIPVAGRQRISPSGT